MTSTKVVYFLNSYYTTNFNDSTLSNTGIVHTLDVRTAVILVLVARNYIYK